MLFFFFFQAEDGIRDLYVTGVQTCALPISQVDGDDVGALLGEPHRVAAALPPSGAGNEGDLALDTSCDCSDLSVADAWLNRRQPILAAVRRSVTGAARPC